MDYRDKMLNTDVCITTTHSLSSDGQKNHIYLLLWSIYIVSSINCWHGDSGWRGVVVERGSLWLTTRMGNLGYKWSMCSKLGCVTFSLDFKEITLVMNLLKMTILHTQLYLWMSVWGLVMTVGGRNHGRGSRHTKLLMKYMLRITENRSVLLIVKLSLNFKRWELLLLWSDLLPERRSLSPWSHSLCV